MIKRHAKGVALIYVVGVVVATLALAASNSVLNVGWWLVGFLVALGVSHMAREYLR